MNPQTIKVACSNCNLRELCMPMGLSDNDLNRLDDLVATRRKIKRGTTLFTNGEKFTSLYAIRTGFFKTCPATEDGRDQVTGFQMAGEIIGLDGIVHDHHTCDATALEDAEVCVMPFDRIEELSREVTALQSHVHTRDQQPVFNGAQALGAFRMTQPHIVLETSGMRVIGSVPQRGSRWLSSLLRRTMRLPRVNSPRSTRACSAENICAASAAKVSWGTVLA